MRDTRSQIWGALTTVELQSSDSPRVTTETTIGSPAGENSKASLAHVRSSCHTTSAPASNVDLNSVSTRADKVKSPASGPTSPGGVQRGRARAGVDEPIGAWPGGNGKSGVLEARLHGCPDPAEGGRDSRDRTDRYWCHRTGHANSVADGTPGRTGMLIRPTPARFRRTVAWCTSESRLPPT